MDTLNPIRAYRDREGISATELAKRLNVARNTVWRWENGRQGIDPEIWGRLHRETGIPTERLAVIGKEVAA